MTIWRYSGEINFQPLSPLWYTWNAFFFTTKYNHLGCDCVFQAKEADTEGIQAILVQVPGYFHFLFQKQRGEHRRAYSTDKPQRYWIYFCIYHYFVFPPVQNHSSDITTYYSVTLMKPHNTHKHVAYIYCKSEGAFLMAVFHWDLSEHSSLVILAQQYERLQDAFFKWE